MFLRYKEGSQVPALRMSRGEDPVSALGGLYINVRPRLPPSPAWYLGPGHVSLLSIGVEIVCEDGRLDVCGCPTATSSFMIPWPIYAHIIWYLTKGCSRGTLTTKSVSSQRLPNSSSSVLCPSVSFPSPHWAISCCLLMSRSSLWTESCVWLL